MIRYSKCYCGNRPRIPTPDLGTDSTKEQRQQGTLGIVDNEWHSMPLQPELQVAVGLRAKAQEANRA